MDIILIAALCALAAAAIILTVRRRKKGGSCCPPAEKAVRRVSKGRVDPSEYPCQAVVEIGGMTCENCARRVENALNELDGVSARVSLGGARADLRFKNPPDEAAIRAAVSRAGYAVRSIAVK